jgi:hypothetical protein
MKVCQKSQWAWAKNRHVGPDDTYVGAKYLAASLWYIPLGIEYLWGQRQNLNDEQGRADRVNGLIQYNF